MLSIERHFHALILERVREFGLAIPSDLPRLLDLDPASTDYERREGYSVPGMYGGFAYWFEDAGGELKLMTESWSRILGGSGQRHEISANGTKLLEKGFV